MGEHDLELLLEQAQHDSIPTLSYGFELHRRDFFKLLGGGLVVCLAAKPLLSQESGARSRGETLPTDISAWLHVNADGTVTVYTGKVEMGQNIRTSLTQQLAEELRAPVDTIHLVMGDTALTPYDRGTFGSLTTPTMGPQLRKVGAVAREELIALAAQRWGTDASVLAAADGKVTDPRSHRALSYAELARDQKLMKLIASDVALVSPSNWTVTGKPVSKVDGKTFVTGRHKYPSDLDRPGMLCGKVLRPTAFHARLASFDAGDAASMPGVTVVHDGDFVGVAAPDPESASRALGSLRAQWHAPQQTSETTLFEDVRTPTDAKVDAPGGEPVYQQGNMELGFAAAGKTLSRSYQVHYIAHVPLEPRAAVAEWKDGTLTVWTGTQRPFAVREELATAFRIPLENVRVQVPDTGAAYGGKHTGDAAIEAARLAKAAGKPVKVVWTREEEFTWAYFRPAGVIDIKSGVLNDGTLVAWQFHNYNSGPAGMRVAYNIPHQQLEFHPTDPPLRQGSYRGLAAPANHFAREVHMDELAALLGLDPLEFRLKNLIDPRARAVLQTAAQKFGWSTQKRTPAQGFGIALGMEKGSYVATCCEVAIENRKVRVARVAECFECGAVVNPNGLRNQISGAIVQGMGGALFEAIHFANGCILNPRLAEYRVPRFSDMPRIEIETLDRTDIASAGAGETPIMAVAPAISNAIFSATGQRLRALPLVPDGLPPAEPNRVAAK
ncbi:MAG TPA: molybdopterin cofactor-binding domain-containing protein [Terriglobales bacterium]|nr:molybdopterin cofactor-binding domain-containing protein [Terriglobales bacterium]